MKQLVTLLAVVALALGAAPPSAAQQTVGLFQHDADAYPGLNLFGTLSGTQIMLIDNDGRRINDWVSAHPSGNAVYLTDDGDLYRCSRWAPAIGGFGAGGQGGRIERFAWDGTLEWDFIYSDSTKRHHHDLELLPNGNVLLIAWEVRSASDALASGRDPATIPSEGTIWPETIVEIEPVGTSSGNVVWIWKAWDHLIQDHDPTKANFGVVADHPELIDINFLNGRAPGPDWHHANAIDYNAELDQIAISLPFIDEIWVIDHSTTTAEAAGHTGGNSGKGGDLLYRWGNPQAYRRGTDADRQSFFQHNVQWIKPGLPGAGNILFYNNRNPDPAGDYSTVVEIVPPVDTNGNYAIGAGAAFGPAAPTWVYSATPLQDLYSGGLSSAQRLPNGNTLIGEGQTGTFTEVTSSSQTVWEYVNPVAIAGPLAQGDPAANQRAFRVTRYPLSFPGFVGKDLTPGELLEIHDSPIAVPGGSTALLADRLNVAGDAINVRHDVAPCASDDYNLIYGSLGDVANLDVDGGECGIGIVGDHDWLNVPTGDLWFLVVGTDASDVYESSWGLGAGGSERNGNAASGQCGATNKDLGGVCP